MDTSLEQWKASGRTFAYRGHPIFYRDEGSGPALLCIHGFPTASWDWHRVWPMLVDRYRLIAADMIGFGFSSKPRDYPYSMGDQATLHESLLAFLGVSEVHILAHDYGDTVAQELLARFETRQRTNSAGLQIRSICFLNGGLFPETHRARPIQKLLLTPLGPLLARLYSERPFRRSFPRIFGSATRPSDEETAQFWILVAYNGGNRIVHKLIRYIDERRHNRDRWLGALQRSSIPLRLVNGAADPVSGSPMAERYREIVPNADIVLLEGIGHYPQTEDPVRVVRALHAFWEHPY